EIAASRTVAGTSRGAGLKACPASSRLWARQIENAPRAQFSFLHLCQGYQRSLRGDRYPACHDGRITPAQQYRLSAREPPCVSGATPQRRQCRQPRFDGQQGCSFRGSSFIRARGLQCVEAHADILAEGPYRGAAQGRDMPQAAQQAAEVAGERAHISSLAALRHELCVILISRLDQFEAMNFHRACRDFHRLTVASEIVRALAVDLNR